MSWQHRIFKDGNGVLTFRECFYDEEGEVEAWSAQAVYPEGHVDDDFPIHSLRTDLCRMLLALSKPVIDEEKTLKNMARKTAKEERKKERLKKS